MTEAADFDVVELAPWTPPADGPAPLREVAYRANAWLPEDDARLREFFAADTPIDTLAWMFERTVVAVRYRMWQLGLRRRSALPWNELEDEELARRYGVDPAAAIAQDFGRAVTAVYMRAQLLGLSEPSAPPWSEWEDAQLVAGFAADIPVLQVAALIGRTYSAVNTRAHKLGVQHPSFSPEWSAEEDDFILTRANEGEAYAVIAAALADAGHRDRPGRVIGQRLRKLGYNRGWGRAWTTEESDLLRLYYQRGDTLTPLQRIMGRTRTAIAHQAKVLGLGGTHKNRAGWRQGPDWTPEEVATLKRLYGTMPTRALAAQMGRELRAIYTRANVLGLSHPWMRAFSADEDLAIHVAWRIGLGVNDLGLALGRDGAVVHKRAKRLGLSFGKAGRPAGGSPRRAVKVQGELTLAGLLALATDEERARPARVAPPKGQYRRKSAAAEQAA